MNSASIPVDIFNPGQVFACLGLLEAAEAFFGSAEGVFDWTQTSATKFTITTEAGRAPMKEILAFLRDANISAVSPNTDIQERDGGATSVVPGVHPCKITDDKGKVRSALLPIRFSSHGREMLVASWTDFDSGRELLQLWTATNGNSAFARLTKLHAAYKAALCTSKSPEDAPFDLAAPVAANFRLELRRNWTALNLGFSPDKINKRPACVPIEMMTYPAVELLAAIGLNNARPTKVTKLEWMYAAWGVPLSAPVARVAISGTLMPEVCRKFRMILEEPNDGGDLSIADSYEELQS